MYFYITRSMVAAPPQTHRLPGTLPDLSPGQDKFYIYPGARAQVTWPIVQTPGSQPSVVSLSVYCILACNKQVTDRTLPTTQYPESCGPTSVFLAPNPLFTPNVSWIRKCAWPSTSTSSQQVGRKRVRESTNPYLPPINSEGKNLLLSI